MTRKTQTLMAAAALFSACAVNTIAADAPGATANATPAKVEAPAAPTFESVLAFLPDTVAEIGNKKITKAQLITELKAQIPVEAFAQIPADETKKILKNIIDNIVDREILFTYADKNGMKSSPEVVNEAFDKMFNNLPADRRQMFENMLKQQGKTLESYKAELAKDPMAQKGIALNKWVEENVIKNIKVSDADVEKFYRENQESFKQPETVAASHILIAVSPVDKDGKKLDEATLAKADADALKKANDLLSQLKQGAKFEDLASANSDCPSKANKGSLGTFGKGQMVKPFEDATFALEKKGDITEVVKTPYGYHIIRLDDKKPAGFRSLASVKDEIKDYLVQKDTDTAIKDLIAKEKATEKVKINGFDDVK